ncbi:MAG: hypothetical protein DHS20C02_05220 [Micavibrio sp.]|nr:MAG: hypothetical protein DHS20C02_05220 [Micavibrio sp.]
MPNRSKIIAIVLLLAICAIGLFSNMFSTQFVASEPSSDSTTPYIGSTEAVELVAAESEGAHSANEIEIAEETPAEEEEFFESDTTPAETTGTATIDVKAALKERRIGNPDAPVTIYEFASLTCGHCGHFHKDMFPQLKEQSIDTGKASLVFNDFPLNKPALEASMTARCLPEGRYFSFIKLLFETQDDWAYDANYIKYLKQNAQLAGLSGAEFDACINNEELRDGILARMKSAQEKYEINSTPTFAIGETMLRGGMPLKSFTKAVDDAAKAKAAPETEPSTE